MSCKNKSLICNAYHSCQRLPTLKVRGNLYPANRNSKNMNRKTKKFVTFKMVFVSLVALLLIAIPLKNGTFKVKFLETSASTEENEIVSNYINALDERLETVEEYTPNTSKVIYFYTASWCGACNAIRAELNTQAKLNSKITVVEVDINAYRYFANQYSVSNTPSLVFIEEGQSKVIETLSIPEVQETVDKFVNLGILSI